MIPLNKDCLALIFAYCGIYNKLNISLTCKYFNKICNDNTYFLNLENNDIKIIFERYFKSDKNIWLIELFIYNNLIDPHYHSKLPINLAFYYKIEKLIKFFYKNNIINSDYKYNDIHPYKKVIIDKAKIYNILRIISGMNGLRYAE